MPSQVAEQAAGKAVSCAGGVDDFFKGKSRRSEEGVAAPMCPVVEKLVSLKKAVAPYSPCLTSQSAGPHGQHRARRLDEVVVAG